MKIEKTKEIGFCFGVKRAVAMLEKAAAERDSVETLGAVVHNQQVLQRLEALGVRVVRSVSEVRGRTVAIASHGASPLVEAELRERGLEVINTTCPFVHRVQIAARRLSQGGFFVVVYGDAAHTEVKGVLGWAEGKGLATRDAAAVAGLLPLPRRIGVLSQTTQVPVDFTIFARQLLDLAFIRDSELRIIDTICHGIRTRQAEALELAGRVDLMLVIGGRSSANTSRLAELCATITETRLVQSAEDIVPAWFKDRATVGITSGASTPEATIDEVTRRLAELP